MGKNYLPEVAKMFDVEVGEKFDIVNSEDAGMPFCPYTFNGYTIRDCNGYEITDSMIFNLLKGEATIKKQPWRPNDGEDYYYIRTIDGFFGRTTFSSININDLAALNMGNCFQTKEAAETARPEMLAKFKELREGVRKTDNE
ncbi:hypothetical protein [Eubacterium sp.]|uniref:hypothetical protein n=1 Tax=Eubacterium sp. TaxID=142586 RepID=UPI0026DF0777|nr:hypothetical protein [Eubacterium sp.]MDO5433343.1 hypothetical protein [Eubacterium sp.]